LQPQRLELLGVAMPTKFRNLARVRAVCQTSRHCPRDLARNDPQVGLESYCLNGPMIDVLTLSTDNRKGSSEDRGWHAVWMTGRIEHKETRIHDMMDRLDVEKPGLVRLKTTR
jgi:hypothetical protein